ncbi:hypothetical protein SAMN05428945_4866 [Streptomyces sp. 2224.1]|nr:hypothetical protein SAMN05428945_4866 [Streptomyces sp. 2224.1]
MTYLLPMGKQLVKSASNMPRQGVPLSVRGGAGPLTGGGNPARLKPRRSARRPDDPVGDAPARRELPYFAAALSPDSRCTVNLPSEETSCTKYSRAGRRCGPAAVVPQVPNERRDVGQ